MEACHCSAESGPLEEQPPLGVCNLLCGVEWKASGWHCSVLHGRVFIPCYRAVVPQWNIRDDIGPMLEQRALNST